MAIEFVAGDLFANQCGAEALGHGCNCQGSMGAGIATGFRDRYPAMFAEFRRRCKAQPRQFNLGDAWLWKEQGQVSVFNLGTQEGVWRARASYEAIAMALTSMRRQADEERIGRIALPRIGAGLGGLSWIKVRNVIETTFAGWSGTLFVYEEYVAQAVATVGNMDATKMETMRIHVASRRKGAATLARSWPGALIVDITSKGKEPWIRFSPFYPHGGIPIPGFAGQTAQSVEGLWQGLKVFEREGVDAKKWAVTDLKGIKRAAGGKRGVVLGHRLGAEGSELLGYLDARLQIYLPAYRWVLENALVAEVARLRQEATGRDLVLLDYETNGDVEDLTSPLSHASLVKRHLEGDWPGLGVSAGS